MTAIQRMRHAILNHVPLRLSKGASSVSTTVADWVKLVIGIIIGIVMIPIVEFEIRSTNTTAWNFTGVTGAVTLFKLIPFIFIAGVIIWFIGRLFGRW